MPIYAHLWPPTSAVFQVLWEGFAIFQPGQFEANSGQQSERVERWHHFCTIACLRHCDVKRVKETLTGQNIQSLQQSRNWSKPVQGFSHFWPRAHLFGCCTYVAEGKAYIWHEFPVITLLAPQGCQLCGKRRSILHQADNLRDPHSRSGCTVVHTFFQHRKI